MSVGASIDFIRLNWVKDEIESSLRDAGVALEAYVENPDDNAVQLKNCNVRLHEVSGALRMLELSGPGILALEMENMAASLSRGTITRRDEAIDALSRAILQLPDQLERLQSGQLDVPLALLPVINELRALRGEKLLEEFTLFKPDLTVFMPVQRDEEAGDNQEDAQILARRLRPIYQKSLVAWFRNPRSLEQLQRLGAVLLRLSGAAQRYAAIQLWWVGGGLVQAIGEGAIADANRAKQLLGQLDQQLKRLVESGEAAIADHPPERLIREMLYLLSRCSSEGEQVREIRETFQLDALLPRGEESNRPVGPNLELLRTVSGALKEDLAKAKDVLDIYVASQSSDPAELAPLIEGLGKVADILAMVNLESSQAAIERQVEKIRDMVSGALVCDDDQIMDLAGVLLSVDNALDELALGHVPTGGEHADARASANAQFEEALGGVVREAINDMSAVKEAILAFLADPNEKRVLEVTPRYVERVSGCLEMLSHERAAKVAERIGDYLIEGLLNTTEVPAREALDGLADAITGLEYFVESTREQRPNADQMLEMAAERLRQLGFPLEQMSAFEEYGSALDIDLEAQLAETQVGNEADIDEGLAEAPPEPVIEGADEVIDIGFAPTMELSSEVVEQAIAGAESPVDEVSLDETPAEPAFAPQESTVESAPLAEEGAGAPPPIAETAAEPVASPVDEAAELLAPVLSADADPETVEIFFEEAEEIRDVVRETFGRWRENQGDEEALAELRRSFHTLKGSGRLVGAMRMGEFAWSIENLLNRLIDHLLTPSNALFDLMEQVVEIIPSMVEQLQGGEGPAAAEVYELMRGAEFLSLPKERQEAELAAITASQPAVEAAVEEPVETVPAAEAAAEEVPAEEAPEAPVDEAGDFETVSLEPEPMDPVLYEIFSQETEGHIAAINEFVDSCNAQGGHCSVNDLLLRALHTLHGSARMAGVTTIADLSGALERYAKMLHKNLGSFVPETLDVLPLSVAAIRETFAHLNDPARPLPDVSSLVDRIQVMGSKEHTTQIMRIEGLDAFAASAEEAELKAEKADAAGVFLEEAADLIDAAEESVQRWSEAPADSQYSAQLRRTLHTLKGGARTAGNDAIANLAHAIESLLKPLGDEVVNDTATIELTQRSVDRIAEMLSQVAQVATVTPPDDLIAEMEALLELRSPSVGEPPAEVTVTESSEPEQETVEEVTAEADTDFEVDLSPTMAFDREELEASWHEAESMESTMPGSDDEALGELVDIFLEEAEEILDTTENTLEHWNNNPGNSSLVRELERQLHTLKGGARMAELGPVADLSHVMETLLKAVVDGRVEVSRDIFDGLHQAVDALVGMVEQVRHGERPQRTDPLIELLESIATGRDSFATESTIMEIPAGMAKQLEEAAALLGEDEEPDLESADAAGEPQSLGETGPSEREDEAEVASLSTAAVSDEDIQGEEQEVSTTDAFSAESVEVPTSEELRAEIESDEIVSSDLESITGEAIDDSDDHEDRTAAEAGEESGDESQEETAPDSDERRQAPRVQHETIRVRADLIDDLVNYAGEVGIYRSRLEQQATTFRSNLTELEQTVSRLNQQLRNLEIETEAQIIYRYEKEGESSKEDFDPLELDRFSTMQQLSRALAESVNDLNNLREMLGNLNRESETLLLQQSRVANTLQEGLMRSRMVQFGGLMPRMRRIVRQTCQELGKWAKLRVEGAGVEMDTTVIDRMLPALEHVLRNAIAHGIEPPEVRRSQGKDETGVIALELSRDGPDVVLRVSDDGAGINIEAIRRKAIERGILRADVQLKNEDIVQLILESGLSTADRVTQLAGRGVGMDVVVSEVKQLGGSMQIDTQPGTGTTFILRLPFTLAINRALLVQTGEDLFAIPLANIIGIARMNSEEVERFQTNENEYYEYAGGRYTYRHLGALLGGKPQPLAANETRIPILMVRSGENYTALHVDVVLGSRDVVVKSLGRQMSSVRGLYGATILADGRVVLILDMAALVHRGVVKQAAEGQATEAVQESGGPPTVLVVDDSITIRKVTSRLLERHDMKAMTARDGVDALAVMQEALPDVVLLDIEMPRMDGYDLAAHMRADDRLKTVPIVMITSRTGEKHRQRAMDLGVDRYLGKPYQEAELVETINEMLEKTKSNTMH